MRAGNRTRNCNPASILQGVRMIFGLEPVAVLFVIVVAIVVAVLVKKYV